MSKITKNVIELYSSLTTILLLLSIQTLNSQVFQRYKNLGPLQPEGITQLKTAGDVASNIASERNPREQISRMKAYLSSQDSTENDRWDLIKAFKRYDSLKELLKSEIFDDYRYLISPAKDAEYRIRVLPPKPQKWWKRLKDSIIGPEVKSFETERVPIKSKKEIKFPAKETKKVKKTETTTTEQSQIGVDEPSLQAPVKAVESKQESPTPYLLATNKPVRSSEEPLTGPSPVIREIEDLGKTIRTEEDRRRNLKIIDDRLREIEILRNFGGALDSEILSMAARLQQTRERIMKIPLLQQPSTAQKKAHEKSVNIEALEKETTELTNELRQIRTFIVGTPQERTQRLKERRLEIETRLNAIEREARAAEVALEKKAKKIFETSKGMSESGELLKISKEKAIIRKIKSKVPRRKTSF